MTEPERYLLERARLVTDRLSTPRVNTNWTLHDVTMVRGLLLLVAQLRAYPQERSTIPSSAGDFAPEERNGR